MITLTKKTRKKKVSLGLAEAKSKRQDTNNKTVPLKNSINQTNHPNFIIVAKAKQTWNQPSQEFKLPNNSDPQRLAYTLVQAANHRKLELSLTESQKAIAYQVERIEESEDQLQPEENKLSLEEGQSFEAHQLLTEINVQLKVFGWTLTKVH